MKKTVKIFTLLTLVFTMLTATVCSAKEAVISKAYVDSNTYSNIANAVKDTTTNNAVFNLTAIYKADGTASNYRKVYARANSNGIEYSVSVGDYCSMTIPAGSRSAGRRVYLYCKGNDPSLDCKVSGYWNVH